MLLVVQKQISGAAMSADPNGSNSDPVGWNWDLLNPTAHPTPYVLIVLAIASLFPKIIKSLIPDLTGNYKLAAKASDWFITSISSKIPGRLIKTIGFSLLGFGIYFLLGDLLNDVIRTIDRIFINSVKPDVELIYLLGYIFILALLAMVLTLSAWYYLGKINKEVAALQKAKEDLVSSVEDATRHVLNGFPEIFDRALTLVNQASEELWIVDFALRFGLPHTLNEDIRGKYNSLDITKHYREFYKKGSRDFNSDVDAFYTKLREKLQGTEIPYAYILTLYHDSIMPRFLVPLYNREIFSKVFKDDADYKQRIGFIDSELRRAKEDIVWWDMADRNKRAWPLETTKLDGRFYETESLPIQLLITRKKDDGKFGCLVFMVGTEILEGVVVKGAEKELDSDQHVEPFIEQGFYTESREIVKVYKRVAAALLAQAKQSYDAPGNTTKPPYEKKHKRNRNGTFEDVPIQ